MEESSDFEQIDRICQSAVFFEGIDAATPNLKRMRAFDQMLKRNGISPVFIDLDERTALISGNRMAAIMFARFGRASTNVLIAGYETLGRLSLNKLTICHNKNSGRIHFFKEQILRGFKLD